MLSDFELNLKEFLALPDPSSPDPEISLTADS